VSRICAAISAMTGRAQTLLDQAVVVGKLNRMMISWANYFCRGPVSKAYRPIFIGENGAPGEIRTPDPLLRRQMLYPAELRAR
jgi:Group II intron, maturase-specific domain